MPKEVVRSTILDAQESLFFARQLEHIKAKSYDVVYPEFKGLQLIPISTEAGSGAESITYQQYDHVGLAKVIASYADDLPRSDAKGKEVTAKVRGIGGSYGYSLQEIRRAQMAGQPLEQRKANAARFSNDQTVNDIAWFGDTKHGLQGLIYHPNVTKQALITGDWLNAARTADQIIADVNDIIADQIALTKGVEMPNRFLMPVAQFAKIASMPRTTGTDTTVLSFLRTVWKEQIPDFEFAAVAELAALPTKPVDGTAGPIDVVVVYRFSPDKLTLEIPQPYEQLPAQERGLEFVVPTHSRCGGVIIYYPLSVSIGQGV